MTARVLGSLAVGGVLVAAVAFAHASARASELATELGSLLNAYAGATQDEGARVLRVNGARLDMRTGVTADSIDVVLARQLEACGSPPSAPAVRLRSDTQGVLGCFAAPGGESLPERLLAFAQSGELAALGEARVTWVLSNGEERRYVAIALAEPLALSQMFPAKGDAPGFDARGLPRPPRSKRVLSAAQEGSDPMLLAYRSELSMEALQRAYRAILEQQGHAVERTDGPDGPALLVHGTAGSQLVLLGDDGSGALAVIVPLATQPHAAGDR